MNLTYQRRKAEKRCISCGAQTERTLAGMSRCSKCQKIAAIKRYERGEERRKKGLCVWCKAPSTERLCPSCRERERKYLKDYKKRWKKDI